MNRKQILVTGASRGIGKSLRYPLCKKRDGMYF